MSAIFLNIIHRLYRYIHYQFSDYTSEKINYYTLLVISVYVSVKSCAKVFRPRRRPMILAEPRGACMRRCVSPGNNGGSGGEVCVLCE